MTSRTTPVGIIVIALAGLIAVGCNASTSAVFQALVDPAGTAVSSPGADPAMDPATSVGETWWPHPDDGYAMDLPAGWMSVAVERGGTEALIDAFTAGMPALTERIDDTLAGTKTRVSAIAADPLAEGTFSPVLLVLAQPTEGMKLREVKRQVATQIEELPGLKNGFITPLDVVLNGSKAVRFDYTLDDPDLGELRVRSYLYRFGRKAYLVNFVAAADLVDDEVEAIFDEIADSLRFGL